MKTSIIICTYNRAACLEAALNGFLRLEVPPEIEWEVLVIDNNSTDTTRIVCEAFERKYPGQFRYIFEGRQGKSFALNSGIEQAEGEILAFTDDDATVDPHWLAELVSTLGRYGCAGVGGKIVPVWDFPKPHWLEMEGPYRLMDVIVRFDLGEEPCPITTGAYGVNMAFKKEVFRKHGKFRADLGPTAGTEVRGEDTEYCRRLLRAGESLTYAPTAVVYHPVDKGRADKSYFQNWYYGRGIASMREGGCPESAVTYFGVPRYLFRILFENTCAWVFCLRPKRRFYHKLQVYETLGQIAEARRVAPVGR